MESVIVAVQLAPWAIWLALGTEPSAPPPAAVDAAPDPTTTHATDGELLPVQFDASIRFRVGPDPDLRHPFGPRTIPSGVVQRSVAHLAQSMPRHDADIRDPFARIVHEPHPRTEGPPPVPIATPTDLVDPFDPSSPRPMARGACGPSHSGGVQVQLPNALRDRCKPTLPATAAAPDPLVDPFSHGPGVAATPTPAPPAAPATARPLPPASHLEPARSTPPGSPMRRPPVPGDLADPFSEPIRSTPAPSPASSPPASGGVSPPDTLSRPDRSV